MQYDFDVIVVGGGAGGATFAYACALAGKSVLVLERGDRLVDGVGSLDEKSVLIDKRPYDDREIMLNGKSKRLYMGGVLGGGTSLYGAVLIRPSEQDFQPGRHYGKRVPKAIWEWPIAYSDLEPHYTEVERLFKVAGSGDDDFGPLRRPEAGYPGEPLPLHPINERLMAANRRHGLRPFRLPMAIDSSKCLRCAHCAGFACPTGARGSSAQLLDMAQRQGLALTVLPRVEVVELGRDRDSGGTRITVLDRATGRKRDYRAQRYALAAGAFATPLLLMRSGIHHPLLGRNYMMHMSSLVAGVFPKETEADSDFIKQVGFADFYFGTKKYPHKMGLVQSLSVPGPLMTAKVSPYLPDAVRGFLRKRMIPLAGIIEDLPNPANRVAFGDDGRPKITHRYARYDRARRKRMTPQIARILKRSGAVYCIAARYRSHEHVAHQCGTLRFGANPVHAVLDPDCRLYSNPDVFVVDGSFMPTSLGVNPGLTIMANALRVASKAVKEL